MAGINPGEGNIDLRTKLTQKQVEDEPYSYWGMSISNKRAGSLRLPRERWNSEKSVISSESSQLTTLPPFSKSANLS